MASEDRVIVVGGGLAGLTAACELLEKGCKVTILEKNSNLGGAATKATCGIAVPGSDLQKAAGIEDSGKDLIADGPAAQALIQNGAKDVDWLLELANVKDEVTLRLTPGHGKIARTLGTKDHFPGAVVTYGVIHALELAAKANPDLLQIVTGATVTRLLTKGAQVSGAEYSLTKSGQVKTVSGCVLLSTGGFAGDSSKNSILSQVAPQLLNMPSTSDERENGDGIRLGSAVGAATDKLSEVSIYPTAAVIPGQENEKFKIVLSDAICGAGGKLIDANGARFVDELSSAQVRSDAMAKAKGPFRLVIGEKEAYAIQWLIDFYVSRKVVTLHSGGANDLARAMKVPATALKEFGSDALYVATVTPALYSCSGGLATGWEGENAGKVMTTKGSPIPGLFAAGEVSSSPYSKLWGISGIPLLHCINSGRAAAGAVAATLGANGKETMKSLASKAAEKKEEPPKKPEDMTKDELVDLVKKLEAGGSKASSGGAAVEAGPPGVTVEEVAKHNKKDDAWIILFGEAIDVTKWIPIHPGGEQAIISYLGQDATEEWQMIHKPGTIEKNSAHVTKMGKIGAGGAAPAATNGGGGGGLTMADVAKHNTKEDAWVVINGEALDVTKWIPIHPGGEPAIMMYLGKDATEEWNMIHKPGTVEKNLANVKQMGKVEGGSAAPPPAAAVDDDEPPPEGHGCMPGPLGALWYMLVNVLLTTLKTVLFTGNFKFSLDNNRKGTIRSAVFLLTFTLVHAGGNFVDMLGGPDELNGEGYLFDRIHWTGGLGLVKSFPFSVVEEYLALALLVHVSVALKRSWDISINYTIRTGRWNMMLSGLTVLFFLSKHLQDFRFYPTFDYVELYAPKYMVAFDGILQGRVFTEDPSSPYAEKVIARDLYSREVVLFKDISNVILYTACIVIFCTHLCLGWQKLIPADAMQIPRDHQATVIWIGWIAAIAVGGMYSSVPWYVYFATPEVVKHVAQ
eukprot:TRINITY_DN31497_c0_g1_i1.p1 TRINITY_DN31497_c0_g1~~TRINITY_DN31497_c0_g1_i1.p1  ORF type:complete len:967 (-),score=281.29 TRINITY_DN31497_c0_g1_i1:158-3058(-)